MMDALISARDGIIDVDDRIGILKALPPIGRVAGTLGRWEPWVRAYVILQDLLAPLRFEPIPDDEDQTDLGLRLMHHGAVKDVELVRITRPSPEACAPFLRSSRKPGTSAPPEA